MDEEREEKVDEAEVQKIREETARLLLRVGAVAINLKHPFRYVSGILSPIYCDNRLLISFPDERSQLVAWMIGQLTGALGWGKSSYDVIAGTATAGIPWAAWVAEYLHLPMVYVRDAAKDHGKGRRIEGRLLPGQRVVVTEDLVTTGGSSLSTIDALGEAGGKVSACVAIFTYDLPRAWAGFGERGVKLLPLTNLPTLLAVAGNEGYIQPDQQEAVKEAIYKALGVSS